MNNRDHEALFHIYDKANPQVYEAFVRLALELKTMGAKRFGAKAIFEKIRWETRVRAIQEPGFPVLKVNNNYPAYYARKLASTDPVFWRGFFEFRDVATSVVAA